jgi:hypothetical protein
MKILNRKLLFEKYILIFHYSDNSQKVRYILLVPKTKIHVQVVELRGKQTQILRGQQRGNGSAKMISMAMQFIIIAFI